MPGGQEKGYKQGDTRVNESMLDGERPPFNRKPRLHLTMEQIQFAMWCAIPNKRELKLPKNIRDYSNKSGICYYTLFSWRREADWKELYTTMVAMLVSDEWAPILTALTDQAKQGNVAAIQLALKWFWDGKRPDAEEAQKVVVNIDNSKWQVPATVEEAPPTEIDQPMDPKELAARADPLVETEVAEQSDLETLEHASDCLDNLRSEDEDEQPARD